MAAAAAAQTCIATAGKHSLVVGGTNGIGQGIALHLAKENVSVTIVGRSKERGLEMVEEMKKQATDCNAKFDFVSCDVMDLQAIRKCAEEIKQKNPVVDYLVLTAGIATTQGRTETKYGIDQKLSIHYYSRVLFAQEMIPALEASSDGRVLFVLSGGVHHPYAHYQEDPELKTHYSLKNAADAAGFYTDIAVDSLSKEHPKLTFIHAAPGFVNTAWGTEMPGPLRFLIRCIQPFGKSPARCAELLTQGLFQDSWKGGFRIMTENATPTTVTNRHEEAREFIWSHTKSLLAKALQS